MLPKTHTELMEQIKGYLLHQQVWPTQAILSQAMFWIEEGKRLREQGTLSEDIALSTELALRIGLALGHLGQPPSVPKRVEMRRQIKATLRAPHTLSADHLMRKMDQIIEVALFHLERQPPPSHKQRESDEGVDWERASR